LKNQYFGDENDYKKYGLLRVIQRTSGFKLLITWMLTPNDGRSDGKRTKYLSDPGKWRKYDPELFDGLRGLLRNNPVRRVSLIEDSGLIPNVQYFSWTIKDRIEERNKWFKELKGRTKGVELIFVDPDNGLEIKSVPMGKKNSSKYICWEEIETLWRAGVSLLVYQHYSHENRRKLEHKIVGKLRRQNTDSIVMAFKTSQVLFLFAVQPRHLQKVKGIEKHIKSKWGDQVSLI